jgi:hypothetical protein
MKQSIGSVFQVHLAPTERAFLETLLIKAKPVQDY